MNKDKALKLALEALEDATRYGAGGFEDAKDAIKQALEQPVQEFVCSTGLCHYKPAAPDLQAELDATNRQVEILSDALADSRWEVVVLKAVQKPVQNIEHCIWARNGNTPCPHTTPPAAPVQEPVDALDGWSDWKVTPPAAQRQWVDLTDEQRNKIWSSYRVSFIAIDVIEAKIRELNT